MVKDHRGHGTGEVVVDPTAVIEVDMEAIESKEVITGRLSWEEVGVEVETNTMIGKIGGNEL